MSRAIRLTRIHALNWYGYRDSIPIQGNLLLAGVTEMRDGFLPGTATLLLVAARAASFRDPR